jgi:hypothetical protein
MIETKRPDGRAHPPKLLARPIVRQQFPAI